MLNFSPRHKSYSFTKRVYATKNPDLVTNIFSFFFGMSILSHDVVGRCGCSKMLRSFWRLQRLDHSFSCLGGTVVTQVLVVVPWNWSKEFSRCNLFEVFFFQYGCFRKWWVYPPNHPWINRVFHYFHHPFWGTPIFGNTHILPSLKLTVRTWKWMDGRWFDSFLGWSIFRCFYSLEQVSFGGVAYDCIFEAVLWWAPTF